MATVNGTLGNDILSGTAGDDSIFGLAGIDTLKGGGGADLLDGGSGTDTVLYADSTIGVQVNLTTGVGTGGTAEGDTYVSIENVFGSGHADTLTGNGFANDLNGAGGNDLIAGGGGADIINGESGDDILSGGIGADQLIGGAGADDLDGGAGNDILQGGFGDDDYFINSAGDVVVEAIDAGHDRIFASFSFSLANNENVEDLYLSGTGANDGTGNALDNLLVGTNADNILDGGAGADIMTGRAGNDTYRVDDPLDEVHEQPGEGIDHVEVSLNSFELDFQVENATLMLGTGGTLIGSGQNNILVGNAGNDALDGDFGGDQLTGGGGGDRFCYNDELDSGLDLQSADFITDFDPLQGDRIDVRQYDANDLVAGIQGWTFIGTADYTAVGQVRVVIAGNETFLAFSSDDAPDNEAAIRLQGLPAIDAGAFIF
jgi:Ca2+-binding RTX toxin-like protein